MEEDEGNGVTGASSLLGFCVQREYSETAEMGTEDIDNGKEKRVIHDVDFENNDSERRDGSEKKDGQSEMKNSSQQTSACNAIMEIEREDISSGEKRGGGEVDGIKRDGLCEYKVEETRFKNQGFRVLGLEDNVNGKGNGEEVQDYDFEGNEGGEKRDEICEKNVIKSELEILSLHETEEYTAKLELNIENGCENGKKKEGEGPDYDFDDKGGEKGDEISDNGNTREKREEGPNCNFENIDGGKRDEIRENKEGEEEMKGNGRDEFDEKRDGKIEKKEGVKVKYALPYPRRKGRPDCPSYLKTGFCSYGYQCCYNHPSQLANEVQNYVVEKKGGEKRDEMYMVQKGGKKIDEIYEKKHWVEKDCNFEKKKGGKVKFELPYPQRKGMQDCTFYLKNGFCSYGLKCCFNHPPQITTQTSSRSSWDCDETYEQDKINNEAQNLPLPILPGQIDCPYYMKHSSCKYSTNCRYNHPIYDFTTKQNPSKFYRNNKYSKNTDPVNYEDKIRPCYMEKNDSIHYEDLIWPRDLKKNDSVNYEDPIRPCYLEKNVSANYKESSLPSINESQTEIKSNCSNVLSSKIKNMLLPSKFEGDLPSNVKSMLLPPQRLQETEQVPASLSTSETYEEYSAERNENNFEYPERPGKQECGLYTKHRDCKFKYSYIFHHPEDPFSKDIGGNYSNNGTKNNTRLCDAIETEERLLSLHKKDSREHQFYSVISSKEYLKNGNVQSKKREMYPERPGKPECEYYMKHGDCKFKFTCKFHHPRCPYQ